MYFCSAGSIALHDSRASNWHVARRPSPSDRSTVWAHLRSPRSPAVHRIRRSRRRRGRAPRGRCCGEPAHRPGFWPVPGQSRRSRRVVRQRLADFAGGDPLLRVPEARRKMRLMFGGGIDAHHGDNRRPVGCVIDGSGRLLLATCIDLPGCHISLPGPEAGVRRRPKSSRGRARAGSSSRRSVGAEIAPRAWPSWPWNIWTELAAM